MQTDGPFTGIACHPERNEVESKDPPPYAHKKTDSSTSQPYGCFAQNDRCRRRALVVALSVKKLRFFASSLKEGAKAATPKGGVKTLPYKVGCIKNRRTDWCGGKKIHYLLTSGLFVRQRI